MAERRKRKTEETEWRGDRLCKNCHHSAIEYHHGPEHGSGDGWCGACKECQKLSDYERKSGGTVIDPNVYVAELERTPTQPRSNSMSMIDPTEWNLDDSHEPIALKDGTEAILRIIEVTKGTRQETGTEYYTVRLDVPSEPFSKDITDWLDVPSRNMDAKRLNSARQKMMHFMDCFSIDRSRPSDPSEDWVGAEGECILSLRSSEQYGDQNRIAKFVRPK